MTTLVLTSVRTGKELDRITLTDGKLTYQTGTAEQIFEGARVSLRGQTDEQLFRYLTGWSNGYLQIKPAA